MAPALIAPSRRRACPAAFPADFALEIESSAHERPALSAVLSSVDDDDADAYLTVEDDDDDEDALRSVSFAGGEIGHLSV